MPIKLKALSQPIPPALLLAVIFAWQGAVVRFSGGRGDFLNIFGVGMALTGWACTRALWLRSGSAYSRMEIGLPQVDKCPLTFYASSVWGVWTI